MKRLLFCLVVLVAVFALVMPTYAAEVKINGLWYAKAYGRDNYDGDDNLDDSVQYVTQRMRMYFNVIANENLRLVYKNEIDMEWGDAATVNSRNDGGGRGTDSVNMETKNVYLEFMVPDTPVKATMGLQGIAFHRGWFVDDDFAAARFDMNFDPVTVTAYWSGNNGLFNTTPNDSAQVEDTDSSNDLWQLVASSSYKAENMDARLSFAYQRSPNEGAGGIYDTAQTDDNDLFLAMGELNMSFDMISFFIIAGKNFGEADGRGSSNAGNRKYDGYMFHAGVDFALDLTTLGVQFIYASGDKEGDFDDDFQALDGQTFSWAEIISDGYTSDRNASLAQIGGANHPSNMWAVGVGADLKPTYTTTIMLDVYYIGMVEDRTVAGNKEDEIGIEIDARLTQKIYDDFFLTFIGAYMFAEDGYGIYNGVPTATNQARNSGDNAFQVGFGLDFKF